MGFFSSHEKRKQKGDFGEGSVAAAVLRLAVPYMFAEMVQVLYNIVDRIYIGHIDFVGTDALTGVGVTFPIVTIVTAFTALFGLGGAPTFSMERGRGNDERAGWVLGNAAFMLIVNSIVITAIVMAVSGPVLYLFGASESSFVHAEAYLKVYIMGTLFQMLSAGLNPYITNQGFGGIGMWTTVTGAIINIILDPLFIYGEFSFLGLSIRGLDMGIRGAALATIISQMVSAVWVVLFLVLRTPIRLRLSHMRPHLRVIIAIARLGVTNFFFGLTTSVAFAMYNTSLQRYGGDLYVAAMTVNNSVKEFVFLSMRGFTHGAQPVISYNYGARKPERILQAIRFMAVVVMAYTLGATLLVLAIPAPIISIFNDDPALMAVAPAAMRIFFALGAFMSLQSIGQNTFVALGMARYALFFSLLRKVFLIMPMIYILPQIFTSSQVYAVFAAEPVSDLLGGGACFITMIFAVYRKLSAGLDVGLRNTEKL
ncbi:MAG: MATE family efflux transporter [Lachnospiraceae bacterium]|nr:MATE family efflux transporter [Lachnospiraceae bacterium]